MLEGKGDFLSVVESPSGAKVYRYKVTLSDGSVRTYGSGRPPKEEQEAQEDQEDQ